MKIRRSEWLIIGICILGVVYRFILASYANHEPMWDAASYITKTRDILAGGMGVECCEHTPGYPLFLTPMFAFFGWDNFIALRLFQGILDVFTGLLIAGIAKRVFGNRAMWWAFILYICNPLTSAYAGTYLAEVLSCFFVILPVYIFSREKFIKSPMYWVLTGMSLGLLLLTRRQFYYFTFGCMILIALCMRTYLSKIGFFILCFLGFGIISLYSLIAYARVYNTISLVPPYGLGSGALEMNFYNVRNPEQMADWAFFPTTQFSGMMMSYYTADTPGKVALNTRFTELFKQRIAKDWPIFVANYIKNEFWMWDKYFIFVFTDPWYPADLWPVRIGNIVIFMGFFWGIATYIVRYKKKVLESPVFLYTLSLFMYISVMFPLVTNVTRHTIPFYPLLFLWAGYGFSVVKSKHSV